MKCIVNLLVVALLSMVVTGWGAANEPEKPENPTQRKPAVREKADISPFEAVMKLDLTSEQKFKVVVLMRKHAPALGEINKKLVLNERNSNRGMTPELRKKINEVAKQGREEGLKGKELQAFIAEHSPLTAQQKEIQDEFKALTIQVMGEIAGILTEEQIKKLGDAWEEAKTAMKKET